MTVSVVTDDAGLRDLEPRWRALWLRSAGRVPFQAPEWMLPWWSCFGTGRPVVALAEDGLLACYLLGDKLLPIGAGITDYQDMLLARGAAPETASLLLQAVLDAARAAGASAFHFTDLPPEAALRGVATPSGWRAEVTETDPCPVLVLPAGAADLRAAVGPSRARDVRQARHRVERTETHLSSFPRRRASIDRHVGSRFRGNDVCNFEALEKLHALRWRGVGSPGLLCDPRVQAFHRAAVPGLVNAGLLQIPVLRIGGVPAAACYVIAAPQRRYLYLGGFDPAFAFQSPGTLLLGHVIEEALRAGVREVHFLRGDEQYKRAWGAVPRMNAMRAFFPA